MGVALLSAGRFVEAWGEGTTHARDGRPVQRSTVFRACSISKHVTALGVLGLVRQGVLELDGDARRYLQRPIRPIEDRPVTLRITDVAEDRAGDDRSLTIIERRPDNDFHYSSGNFAVIQRILTDATGRPFAEIMQEIVLDPVGMGDSSFDASAPRHPAADVACGHTVGGEPAEHRWRLFPELGTGGLWTTPSDLARVAVDIYRSANDMGGAVLDQDLALQMVSPGEGARFGLGSIVKRRAGQRWFGHPGDLDTYQCFTAMDLDRGNGLVVMANIGAAAPFLPDLLAEIDFPIPPAL